MELTLLRHAPLPKHFQKRYIGHSNIAIDTTLFEKNKIAPLMGKKYDALYSSDLLRCTQTLEQCGFECFIPDTRLREVRFKSHIEGKNFGEIETMDDFDPIFLESQESWHAYICDESIDVFQSRIKCFLDELPREGNVLLCSHAGTIREILRVLDSLNPPKTVDYLDYTIVRVK